LEGAILQDFAIATTHMPFNMGVVSESDN